MGSEATGFDTRESATEAKLEIAYESLLADRENIFSPGEMPTISEEDKLCNQNLQTSFLFKMLNDKATTLSNKIKSLVDDIKQMDDALSKYKSSTSIFSSVCTRYYKESMEPYRTMTTELANEYVRLHEAMRLTILKEQHLLETELDGVSTKLNGVRALIKTGIDDIIKPEDMSKKMCPVCFEKEVSMVMIPCGHTYCDVCSVYDYRAKCPQCRMVINSRVKLYFSI